MEITREFLVNTIGHWQGLEQCLDNFREENMNQHSIDRELFQKEIDETQQLLKDEFDETQTILQTEFDEFEALFQKEIDDTQTLLTNEFNETQEKQDQLHASLIDLHNDMNTHFTTVQ